MKTFLNLMLLVLLLALPSSAQNRTFTPNCFGINDTARIQRLIDLIEDNTGTIRLPYKDATRCAVNSITFPENITIDNSDGTGLWRNTSAVVTVLGPVVSPVGKPLFYGPGTTDFSGNTHIGTTSQPLLSDGQGGTTWGSFVGWDFIVQRDAQGKIDTAGYKVNGLQVVGSQAASISQVDLPDAGATYTTAERDLINDLKSKLNATLTALKTHGLIAVSPTDVSGLKAWYDASSIAQADNSAVTSWTDSSGNGWTVTQATGAAQPTLQTAELNGKPVVRFDGSDFLNVGNSFTLSSQSVTIFVVKKPVSAAAQKVFVSAGLTSSASTAILSYQQFQSTSTLSTHNALIQPSSPFGHQNFARWSYNVLRTSAGGTRFRVNGHESVLLPAPSLGVTEGLNIGAHYDSTVTPAVMFDGDIRAVIIYNTVLSDAGVALVENYLARENGVAPRLVVMDGDSMTRGSGASSDLSDNYPSQLAGLLSTGYDLVNVGVGGQTTADMIADAATEVDPLLTWQPRSAGLVVFWNTNDLHFSASVADTQARIQSYCTSRRAAGWKCIVGTILPRSSVGTPGTYEANRLIVNQWIRDNWSTFADGFFDPAADSRIGDAGDELNATFYNDPAHLNGTGYAIVADLVRAKVVALMP